MVQTAVTISGDKLVQILTKFCNWRKKFVDHSDNYCLLFSVSYMQYRELNILTCIEQLLSYTPWRSL